MKRQQTPWGQARGRWSRRRCIPAACICRFPRAGAGAGLGAVLAAILWMIPTAVLANHSVLIEGDQDFDGDGRIGLAEDLDSPPDFVFGTLSAAIGSQILSGRPGDLGSDPLPGSLAQNGKAIIVTSGRFFEQLQITGSVTLEAAPGVDATIDALLDSLDPRVRDFPQRNDFRSPQVMFPGVTIISPSNRPVVLRNLTVRNFDVGVSVGPASRVLLDQVRLEHNGRVGVLVGGFASIYRSSITSTGFRSFPSVPGQNLPEDFVTPTEMGMGILVVESGRADITDSSFVGNLTQIANRARSIASVQLTRVQTAGGFEDGLRLACRANTPSDPDAAEICVQSLLRLSLGIPEQSLDAPLTP